MHLLRKDKLILKTNNMEYKIKQFLFDDNDKFLSQLVDLQNIVYEGNHIFTSYLLELE